MSSAWPNQQALLLYTLAHGLAPNNWCFVFTNPMLYTISYSLLSTHKILTLWNALPSQHGAAEGWIDKWVGGGDVSSPLTFLLGRGGGICNLPLPWQRILHNTSNRCKDRRGMSPSFPINRSLPERAWFRRWQTNRARISLSPTEIYYDPS